MRLTLAFFVLAFPFAFALCSLASPIRFYARSFCDCCFSVCVRIAFARFATFAFALAFLALVVFPFAFALCSLASLIRFLLSLLFPFAFTLYSLAWLIRFCARIFLLSMLFRLRSRCVRSFRPFAFTLAFFVFVAFPFALASCSLASLRSLLRSHFCFVAFPFAIALRSLVSLSLYALSLLFRMRSHRVRSLRCIRFCARIFCSRCFSVCDRIAFARFAHSLLRSHFLLSVCARIVFARFAAFAFALAFFALVAFTFALALCSLASLHSLLLFRLHSHCFLQLIYYIYAWYIRILYMCSAMHPVTIFSNKHPESSGRHPLLQANGCRLQAVKWLWLLPRGSMATGGPESQDCQAFAQGHNRRACEARVEAFAELAPSAC